MKSGNHPDRFLPSVASFLLQSFFFFFWTTCSAHTSTQCFFLNLRIKEGSLIIECQYQDHVMKDVTYHSSDAIPKSLQHRINALLLHPSDAVGKLVMSKKSCSPLAWDTNLYLHCQYHHLDNLSQTQYLPWQTSAYSREMFFLLMEWSPRGARPQPTTHFNILISNYTHWLTTRTKCFVQYTSILDFWEIQQSICIYLSQLVTWHASCHTWCDFNIVRSNGLLQHFSNFFWKGLCG